MNAGVRRTTEAAIGRRAAPASTPRPDRERSASTPLETRGVLARWTTESQAASPVDLRRQTFRPAFGGSRRRERLGPGNLTNVEVIHTGRSAAGSASRSCIPGRRRCSCPWRRAPSGKPVKFNRGPPRALHRGRGTSAPAASRPRSEFRRRGTAARAARDVLARPRRLHAVAGLIVPIVTSTQLLAPLQAGRVSGRVREALYTNTVIVTPYRGAGRATGRVSSWRDSGLR